MIHEKTLRRHFSINGRPRKWISLETLEVEQLTGFRTRRIAKVYDGERLYFTIGETRKGKRNGLSTAIAGIIRQRGLEVIYVPSTSGRPSLFVGFHLAACSSAKLEQILREVKRAVALCD